MDGGDGFFNNLTPEQGEVLYKALKMIEEKSAMIEESEKWGDNDSLSVYNNSKEFVFLNHFLNHVGSHWNQNW